MPTWLVFMRFLLPWILNLIYGSYNVTLKVPLCAQHKHRLNLATYLSYGLFGLLVVGIILSIGLNAAGNANAGGAVAFVCFLIMLLTLAAILIVQFTTPRVEEIADGVVGLTAVSPQFAAAVQQTSVGNTATTHGLASVSGTSYAGATTFGLYCTRLGKRRLLSRCSVALAQRFTSRDRQRRAK